MLVGIIGKGKMGQLIKTTAESMKIEVAGLYDVSNKEKLTQKVDVLIDFSHRDNFFWIKDYCLKNHCALVYGTTALEQEHLDILDQLSKSIPVFYSANYSYGVAVVNQLLKYVTPLLKEDFDIEILEKHHNQKADAPSGTAKMLLNSIDPNNEFIHTFSREGMIGKREKEIGVFALRGGTEAGEHTVYYFGNDESIEIKHHATSRQIFVNGALKATKYIVEQKPGMYDMNDLIGG